MMDSEHLLAFSTTNLEDKAGEIAKTLVTEGLAACVNILPNLRSIYNWEGKLCDEGEFLLIIKTSSGQVEKIKKRLKEIHNYQVPELIFIPITGGLPEYLSWIDYNTHKA